MPDSHRTRAALATLLADNTSQAISPQDHRDQLLSSQLRGTVTYTESTPTIDDNYQCILLDGTSNTVTAALPDPGADYYPVLYVKAIDITNAVALDPGANNLEGATTDYTFTTVNDAIIVAWDGSAWWIMAEFTNA